MYGGKLVVAGEAEVGQPVDARERAVRLVLPAARSARSIDPLFALGDDLEVHPFLAESIEANEDFTECTIKVREGITFPTARRSTPTP